MAEKNTRASELGNVLLAGTSGFTVRKRTGAGIMAHLFLLACIVVLGASLLVYYKSVEGALLAVAIGLCFIFISHNLERTKKMKQSLEFMNALFSSALGRGYKFCFVVKNTGEIVFYNRPFQEIFPAYLKGTNRTLEALMNSSNMPQADRDKLLALLKDNKDGSFTTALREETAASGSNFTIYVEPIERPTTFFLIRGK